jgi:hypothetical protein
MISSQPDNYELTYEQSVCIQADANKVERCFAEQALMHQWLNPALVCEPVGDWQTTVGSQFKFKLKVPLLEPTLQTTVLERAPGLIVWGFEGFFCGRDRWECLPTSEQPENSGTTLLNRFEFTIPNRLVSFGFQQFAARWTQKDMKAQLQRLKQIAESLPS